jgi:nicotinamidase-related amidase
VTPATGDAVVDTVLAVLGAASEEGLTVRDAAELGYQVTMVRDATADYSDEEMHAALDVNIPNYASAVVGTEDIVASLSAV